MTCYTELDSIIHDDEDRARAKKDERSNVTKDFCSNVFKAGRPEQMQSPTQGVQDTLCQKAKGFISRESCLHVLSYVDGRSKED